jgi:DNA-binding response OmpR family regulator
VHNGLRILLIESNPLMADITSYRLELLGYRVEVASTVAALWGAIDCATPQAIVLNLDSDVFDSFGLLEQFASDMKTSEIPVLALSSGADLDRVERAWQNGAQEYLVTPFDPLALEQKVARLLEGVEADPEILAQGAEFEDSILDAVPVLAADEAGSDLNWPI